MPLILCVEERTDKYKNGDRSNIDNVIYIVYNYSTNLFDIYGKRTELSGGKVVAEPYFLSHYRKNIKDFLNLITDNCKNLSFILYSISSEVIDNLEYDNREYYNIDVLCHTGNVVLAYDDKNLHNENDVNFLKSMLKTIEKQVVM
jgi:hypothetical protein